VQKFSNDERTIETVDEKGQPLKLYILPSNFEINRLCDIEYRKAWTYAVSHGVQPHRFILETFRKNDIWSEDLENELTQLNADIAVQSIILEKFRKEDKKEEAEKIALEMFQKRNRAYVLSELKHEAFINSAEGVASEIRLEAFLAFAVVYYDDKNKRFYIDYEDFKNRREEQASIDITARYYSLIINENTNYLRDLPEARFLTELGIMTKKGNLKRRKK